MTKPLIREVGNGTRADTKAQVRESLTQSGLDSFDAIVERLAESVPRTLNEVPATLVGNLDGGVTEPPEHQVPEMMVVIDGETNEPEVIKQFDGQALYCTPGLDSKRNEVLYCFTSLEGLNEHAVQLTSVRHDIGTTNPDSLPEHSSYFEHDDAGGDRLDNRPGYGWRNLRRVPRGFLGLGDWNDIISSVNWCRWHITLWDLPDFGGNRLELYAGQTYYHLSQYGWGDCVSATMNWGRRF